MLRIVVCLVSGVVAVASSVGCRPSPPAQAAPPPPPVTVARPVVREVTDYEETTGRLAPVEAVELRARVSGYLQAVKFQAIDANGAKPLEPGTLREGDEAPKDAVLFEIDPRPYAAAEAAAQAEVERTVALVGRLSADVKRAETLRASNNISQEEFDKTVSTRAEAVATQKSAEAQLRTAQLNLEFTKVKAPIEGRLGRALVTAGNLITADFTPLVTIVREDPIHVYFDLPEQVVLRYQELIRKSEFTSARTQQLPMWVALGNDDGFPHRGWVDFIDNRVDRSTSTLRIRGVLDNPQVGDQPRRFTPGFFVRVRIPASRPYQAVQISERAITVDQGARVVFTVDDGGTAHRREVQIGLMHDGLRAITAGLQANERIVVNGLQRVRDGRPVKAEEGPMPGVKPVSTAAASATGTGT